MQTDQSKGLGGLSTKVPERLRNEELFNNFYLNVFKKAKLHHFVNEPVLKMKQKPPNYSFYIAVCWRVQGKDYHSETSNK